jgi:undecaprenyl-diphosphatase
MIAALSLALALGGVVFLAASYDAAWLTDLDVEVAGELRGLPGWVGEAARVVGALGGHVVLPLAVVVAVALSLRAGRANDALFVAVVALGADILVHAGRELQEPLRTDVAGLPDESRFPAGHAATSVAIWGALAFLLAQGRSPGRRAAVIASGVALGLVVASARLVLDEQALGDVLAGALLGAFWLLLCVVAYEWLGDRQVSPAAAALVVGSAVFVLLGFTYDQPSVGDADEDVARWVATHLPGWVEWAARPFSWVGGWIGVVAAGIAMAALLVRERAWIDLGFLFAVFAVGQLLANGLKLAFDRPRPAFGSAISLPESAAFPSGHAAAGTACVGALAVLLAERIESRPGRVALWAGAVLLGLGIGLSRVALGLHWVSDVAAGWAFGVAWLALCLLGREAVRRRWEPSAGVG